VALVENATVGFAQALSALDFRAGDRIVTTRADYPSNQLMYLSLARRVGVETVRADDLPEGGVDPESVHRLARHPRTRLVAVSWVPTNSGLVQDARAVGEICARPGARTAPAASRIGSSPTPSCWGWARRLATRSGSGRREASARGHWPRSCGNGLRHSPRCVCWTADGSAAPSSRSTFAGTIPPTS